MKYNLTIRYKCDGSDEIREIGFTYLYSKRHFFLRDDGDPNFNFDIDRGRAWLFERYIRGEITTYVISEETEFEVPS